ncbi:MAG: hypothetical protein GYB67_09110 [Chloroflexi bacterium]|nr:hypothetical protein [Chloroflexota bacterium]
MTSQQDSPLVPEHVEQLHTGIVGEWFLDRQLIVYRLTQVSNNIVTAWSNVVIEMLENWPKERPYLAHHDLSAVGVSLQYATLVSFDVMNIGITPTGRQTAEEIFNRNPEFRARVAIGFNLSVSGQVSQVVMDRIRSRHPSIQYKTFFSRDRSLEWLVESLPGAESAADDS